MSELKFTFTESDMHDATHCFQAIAATGQCGDLKPSEVCGPITMAVLRTRPSGFPITTDDHVNIVHNDTAETLRSIFKRFLDGHSTPQQFASAAMPLIRKLRSQVEADDKDEIDQLIEESKEDGKEPN
jgi:hypothetical protein